MKKDLIDDLEALVINNPAFNEIDAAFDRFCPFEALGVVGHEIRHSNFLAYCLDPARPHGFGSECLKGVMRAVARAYRNWPSALDQRAITPLDFHLMDLDAAQVEREWKRSIDLFVVLPDQRMVIAFELKIDAKEHGQQLRRYRLAVEEHYPATEGWDNLLVFLTKRGDEPGEHGEGWFALELAEVAIELDRIVEAGLGGDAARDQLASYLAMLRRHHLPNDRLEEYAAKLWSQHREALEFLMERSPQGGAGVFGLLYERREELARMLSEAAGVSVVLDDSTRGNIRFAVPRWDGYPDMLTAIRWTSSNRLLLLELAPDGDRNAIRMRFVIGQGDPAIRQKLYAVLEQFGITSRRKTITSAWTRLQTETLVSKLNDSEEDQEVIVEQVIKKVIAYGKSVVPKVDAALMPNGHRNRHVTDRGI
ncbi:hypothetical protein A0J57_10555 [Sphingobium sp. 22B]|uniref:PDDEXK-like family protein n=1 Tax=Sphingobium sp. 22B TaxID=936474 RepID=UPI00078580E1|nr:PD-(D/E)XK nuclease family protein [Sphingobium sp. 22B]KYC32361.1 hypothetical protein A0J57_10555 [Sphingobium sp. 22B]OAP31991.1 hypothetical protein A8O16_10350 [Sphingobium sp. 20006FA]